MARSLLRALVGGTRQMLAAQLFAGIAAVGLAGWTLSVTNQVIRERDHLRERVLQLESEMGARGIVVPAAPPVVDGAPARGATVYPGEVGLTREPGATAADRDFSQVIGNLFAPPPQMRVIVLHVRSDFDARAAQGIADELQRSANVRVVIDVMASRDPRQSGYSYFDGRQSRAALGLVTQFLDIARAQGVAQWSAQLRGVALPAQGEYTADRLDIVLPPLPESAPADPVR